MISKKRSKANFGTAMHVEYVRKKPRYIVKCEYFNRKTGYCKRNGFLVWDYGSEVCERCKFNQGLNNKEEDKNNSTINPNKKQKKNIYLQFIDI